MLREMLHRKPGNELQVLSENAKAGLSAIDEMVRERNALAQEVQTQSKIIEKLTLENESLRQNHAEATAQRDYWIRTHGRLEANLAQLGTIIKTMYDEFHNRKPSLVNPDIKQIAEKFAPETKHVKSVG